MKLKIFLKNMLKSIIPYGILVLWIIYNTSVYIQSMRIFKRYYKQKMQCRSKNQHRDSVKRIIYMADGRRYCGGLADRLRGMTSLYKIVRETNIDFKINFTSPSELTHYLVPNEYNWIIDQSEITYDVKESAVCYFGSDAREENANIIISQLLKKYNQLHITTNVYFCKGTEYNDYFNQLFKPISELQELIDYNMSRIGGDFISATFRFQALLGDFFEGEYPDFQTMTSVSSLYAVV